MSFMKAKLLYLGTAFAVILIALCFSYADKSSGVKRYLQHTEALPQELSPQSNFATHLPIISIDTSGVDICWLSPEGVFYDGVDNRVYGKSEEEIETLSNVHCHVEIISSQNTWHTLQDSVDLAGSGTIRVRGNSSRHFDKKSYLLRLTDNDGSDKDAPVMGMSPASEWVLNGPILDRTLVRNYLCYNVAGQIMDYAPNVRYCELFLNGDYKGLYLMAEPITRDEGRINLTKPDKRQTATSWLIRMDRDGKGDTPLDNFFYYTFQMGVSAVDLRYPGKNLQTPERISYVAEELSEIERAIYSIGNGISDSDYSQLLDTRAFAQYFILNEFFGNVDAGRFSTFYYKDIRGKVTPVVWDFNNCCDNYINYVYMDDGFTITNSPWFGLLVRDKDFVDEVISQYRSLRKTFLSDEYLISFIDDTITYLGSAVDRNYQIYGYVFDLTQTDATNYLTPPTRNYTSYEEFVTQLKAWIKNRGAWLDKHIDTLLQYCQDSKNASRIIY